MPWADGTPCGTDAWCIKSQCVSKKNAKAVTRVDGEWGGWGEWSECSKSCGGGIRSSKRECTDPEPTGTGLYCTGDRVRYNRANPAGVLIPDYRRCACPQV